MAALDDSPLHKATLSQEPEEDQGRIGYGKRVGIYTPLALAIIIIGTLVAVGIYSKRGDIPANNIQVGQAAPSINQATINGTNVTFSLAAQQGKVVVVNFWASWCQDCQDEMPMMQSLVNAQSDKVAIVGVDLKNDTLYAAQRFLQTNNITYPVVRDDSNDSATLGPISTAYGIGTYYPETIVISPNGTIAGFKIGKLSEKQLNDLIEKAENYDS